MAPSKFEPKVCKIGEQTWTAEDLDVETFRNGDDILHAETEKEWLDAVKAKIPAWTYQGEWESEREENKKRGKLYNCYAVNDPRGLAPKGWHIPSKDEWLKVVSRFKMKKIKLINWESTTENINNKDVNKTGFTALENYFIFFLEGYSDSEGNSDSYSNYGQRGGGASWWTSTPYSSSNAYAAIIKSIGSYNMLIPIDRYDKGYDRKQDFMFIGINDFSSGRAVRCVKDEKPLIVSKNKILAKSFSETQIGSQIWMNKNLNVERFQNGDIIQEARSKDERKKAAELQIPCWSYASNNKASGEYIGKLYNWYAINDPRGLAPKGWRIATVNDWKKLSAYIKGDIDVLISQDGGFLTYSPDELGTSPANGFSAFPRYHSDQANIYFDWWTRDKHYVMFDKVGIPTWQLEEYRDNNQNFNHFIFEISDNSGYLAPVRCVKISN